MTLFMALCFGFISFGSPVKPDRATFDDLFQRVPLTYDLHGTPSAPLYGLANVAYHDSKFYFTNASTHCLVIYDLKQDSLVAWGRRGQGPGEFQGPNALVVADDGRVYVSDRGNYRVQVFSPEGSFLQSFPVEIFPEQIFLFRQEGKTRIRLVGHSICGQKICTVSDYDDSGKQLSRFGERSEVYLNYWVSGMTVDGGIMVANTLDREISRFDAEGRHRKTLALNPLSMRFFESKGIPHLTPVNRQQREAVIGKKLRSEIYSFMVKGLFTISELILVPYTFRYAKDIPQESFLDIYRQDGELLAHGIALPGNLEFIVGDEFYFWIPPEDDDDPPDGRIRIAVWRFRGLPQAPR